MIKRGVTQKVALPSFPQVQPHTHPPTTHTPPHYSYTHTHTQSAQPPPALHTMEQKSSPSKQNTDDVSSSDVPSEGESKDDESRWVFSPPQLGQIKPPGGYAPTMEVMSDTASEGDDLGFDDPDESKEEKEAREHAADCLHKADMENDRLLLKKYFQIPEKKNVRQKKENERQQVRLSEKLVLMKEKKAAEKQQRHAEDLAKLVNVIKLITERSEETVRKLEQFKKNQRMLLNTEELLKVAASVAASLTTHPNSKYVTELIELGALCFEELSSPRFFSSVKKEKGRKRRKRRKRTKNKRKKKTPQSNSSLFQVFLCMLSFMFTTSIVEITNLRPCPETRLIFSARRVNQQILWPTKIV